MSITTNGAPLGTDGIKSLASTDSWQSPSDYIDPTTGKKWSADSLEDLLKLLEDNGVALYDHDAMRDARKTTAPKGNRQGMAPSGDDKLQWDRLLIQLNHYPDPEKARAIIVEALANPNVSITRNLGGGRTATKEMQGRRAVIAHEVHHDDERGPHFMAQVHTVALGADGHISQKFTFSRGEDAKPMVEQINAALAENGLAPLVLRLRDETGTKVAERKAQMDAQQSEEYREAAEKGELPELMDEDAAEEAVESMPTSARKETLRQAAELAGAQAASLYAQAQALQKQNAHYRTALRAIEAEEQRLSRIADLESKLATATERVAVVEAESATALAESSQVIEGMSQHLNDTTEKLEATQTKAVALEGERDELKTALEEAQELQKNAEEELATATAANDQLETRLESALAEATTAKNRVVELDSENKGLVRDLNAERLAAQNAEADHDREMGALQRAKDAEAKRAQEAEAKAEKARGDLVDEQTVHGATKAELKSETARADRAETAAEKAQNELAALREQLAEAKALAKSQAAELERERDARQKAEQAVRQAQAAQATAEAQRDARPTQDALQAALAAQATAVGERNVMKEALERVTEQLEQANSKPAPGGDDNKPKGGR